MTIHLPEELENSVRAEVMSGHFASEDDLVAEAVRMLLRQRKTQQSVNPAIATTGNITLGSIGAMRDSADELDKAIEYARELRQQPWRVPAGE